MNNDEELSSEQVQRIAEDFIGDDETESGEVSKPYVCDTLVDRGYTEQEVNRIWHRVERLCKKQNLYIVTDNVWK